jgi:hypothetical protein
VRPAQLLDKGLPIPGLSGRYVVDEGWHAVITVGGAFKEILHPGHHSLSKYSFWRDVKAVEVDTRVQTLNVSTTGEFTIAQPVPVEIDLDLAVEYQVSDPRRVALEIKTPLTSLYDRVIQAVRGIIVHATYDEFRTQGESIAHNTLLRLQAMQLPKQLGIEIFNVLVTSIKGADVIAEQHIKEYTTVRDWQLDNTILQQSQVTPQWLMMHRPEIYQQMLAGNTEVLKELIDKGLVDPAGFLNQPVGADPASWQNVISNMGMATGMNMLQTGPGNAGQSSPPQLADAAQSPPAAGQDGLVRIKEDLRYLKAMSGVQAQARAGTDGATGLPDGTYVFQVEWTTGSGQPILLRFSCSGEYPQQPPSLEIELDGTAVSPKSAILRRWSGQYLVEIAREVRNYYG